MAAGREMGDPMARHRVLIQSKQDPPGLLSPSQDLRVAGPEGKIGQVSYANGVDGMGSPDCINSRIRRIPGPG